ncbi:hypothetical protein GCM10010168_16490 [Actinoplanes ianthinogenes]|uniref:Uncharacterized protein n=1 Tax=Actinoplanes ianthinogenes TaxID=122358 RepID=A0ABN6CGZ5_9ACTN|nr:hypothetical protein [Actinoplanes ianthinogenes]BCJ44836.1 hypothetical protein Aiant_54930 [Actinoplanes ianthinogenes]GGR00280.1 hypothetical protein GCM10010168_16490 [Actinoplanes ianthinogenes]
MLASLLFAVAALALVAGVLLGFRLARSRCQAARHDEAVAIVAALVQTPDAPDLYERAHRLLLDEPAAGGAR